MNLLLEKKASAAIAKAIAVVFFAGFVYLIAPESLPEPARRVLGIFIIAALFWALEVVPLYATSILVVVLEIFLLCRPGGVLGMDESGYQVFLVPFGSPVIILFLGGFVLARALHKYKIDKFIASRLLGVFGNKPYFLMLGFMVTTGFLSMWMSDTATTAMMIAMVTPLLVQLKEGDPFCTALILAVPFSALIGGMGTPVGTPPNAIAMGILADYGIHITFVSWMKMAVPLSLILLVTASGVLYMMFPPREKSIDLKIKLSSHLPARAPQTVVVAIVTIGLWLTTGIHKIPASVISLLAAAIFAITGLLNRDDFKKINWDVLILMWGGLALGKGMQITKLTEWIVSLPIFDQQGVVLVVIFCVLGVLLSTVMSNTATANLLIPIVMVIPGESHILLATTIALSCSLAMALPVSTPPNAIAFATNMLRSKDMFKAGAVISLISLIIILAGFKFVITKAFGL